MNNYLNTLGLAARARKIVTGETLITSAIGKKNRVALGIQDTGFAKILKEKIGG